MTSQLFWLTLLLGAFSVFIPLSPATAQPDALPLQQIVAALDSTSPVLAEARAELERAHSAYTGSRAFPNPSLFGSQETLRDDVGTTERILGVRQSLGFLWSQAARQGTAKATYEAVQAQYDERKLELAAQVVTLAFEYDRLVRQSALMDSVLAQSSRLTRATAARLAEGDIAPYDEQRFALEAIQLQNHKQELEHDVSTTLLELTRLTGLPVETFQRISLVKLTRPSFNSEEEAVSYALEHRPELARSEKSLNAKCNAVRLTRWNQLPDLSVGIGNKMTDPGSDGLYVEAELELPFWGQRRSETNAATAELRAAEMQFESLRRNVEQQVRLAYRQLELTEQLQSPLEGSLADSANVNMNRGVQLYLEGEMNALELVDALRTGIEAQDAALKLRNSLAVARAELRRVTGLEPLEN